MNLLDLAADILLAPYGMNHADLPPLPVVTLAIPRCAGEVSYPGSDPGNGGPCSKNSFAQCADCGLQLCRFHGIACCGEVFCDNQLCFRDHLMAAHTSAVTPVSGLTLVGQHAS